MKNQLLLLLALFCSLPAISQNTTYRYHFDYGPNELFWIGPTLLQMCPASVKTETLSVGGSQAVYPFDKGCGLIYNDATKNFLSSGNYTIELYFKLDTIQGYKKLVDFDSLSKDKGLYNQNGRLVLYPNVTSPDSAMGAGAYSYVAIARNASTKMIYMNMNGKTAGNYMDTGLYVYDTAKKLIFFRDDRNTSGEHTSGTVAMIRISNYAMDSNAIKTAYTNLAASLHITSTLAASSTRVYPNPAKDMLYIENTTNESYRVFDVTGKLLLSGELTKGTNEIDIANRPAGIYLLELANSIGAIERHRIMKQ